VPGYIEFKKLAESIDVASVANLLRVWPAELARHSGGETM
jgi:hypothetical protein